MCLDLYGPAFFFCLGHVLFQGTLRQSPDTFVSPAPKYRGTVSHDGSGLKLHCVQLLRGVRGIMPVACLRIVLYILPRSVLII